MQSLKAFLHDRLAAAAEEILGVVEKTVAEYKEEMCRAKDIEIVRLKLQIKLLKSEPTGGGCTGDELLLQQQQQQSHHPHPPSLPPSPPPPLSPVPHLPQQRHQQSAAEAAEAPESQHSEEDGGSSMEDAELPQVKMEHQQRQTDFWMGHDAEQLEDLESDLDSSPPGLRGGLHDPASPFHFYHHNQGEDGKERPYRCSMCNKSFSNRSNLAAHTRTHTGERPYRCEICRKSFVTTSALNRHQTIHTEGKQFVCNYCDKSFKWMDSLGRHIRIAHKNPKTFVYI